ncbi:MAG: GIY-YIG nuclease family protein [Cytophagales bacterium]|nr:GIY-YIG nuclease family protein [Cytophagales bacterium]
MITRYVEDFCIDPEFNSTAIRHLNGALKVNVEFHNRKSADFTLGHPLQPLEWLNQRFNQHWISCRFYDNTGFCFLLFKNEFKRDKKKSKKHFVYVLELENNKFYIGSAVRLKNRFRQHFTQESKIEFIKRNPIKGVHQVLSTYHSDIKYKVHFENYVTYQYLLIYGPENVHGGDFLNSTENKMDKMKNYQTRMDKQPFIDEFSYIWNNLRSSFFYEP